MIAWILAAALAVPSASKLAKQAPDLDREVLNKALAATEAAWEDGEGTRNRHLTVIDYSLPSTEKRLWVFDLAQGTLVHHTLVAHGRNTGNNRARRFSNVVGSKKSSLGLFRTGGTYRGKHGYSLKLDGLERGVNDNARKRAIVIHGAWYVSASFAREHGRLGRSWGCPALSKKKYRPVIDTIKGGSLIFVYYPDEDWLKDSRFLATHSQ